MRVLPVVLAAVGAISLLAAAVPAKAGWDDGYGRPGWRDPHRTWGPGYYRYGYARPVVVVPRPVVVVPRRVVVVRRPVVVVRRPFVVVR